MRTELKLKKCLGITNDGELVMVDYLFNDELNGLPFHGATGSSFVGVTQGQIDERNDLETVKDSYGYLWQEAVKDGTTTESQDDYIQGLIDSEVTYGDKHFFGHDDSYIYDIPDSIKKMHFDGCETFECIGGGRMFPIKRENMMLIFDENLFEAVEAIEESEQPLEMFQEVIGGELVRKG